MSWSYENENPRLPADGIRARSRSGPLGEGWLSLRFIQAIDTLSDSARLARGRSYARTGQTLAIHVAPGVVAAKVQGSRQEPYRVYLQFPTLSDEIWAQIEAEIDERPDARAQILAGAMPRDIEAIFKESGASLFPRVTQNLHVNCSCPDWGSPCKHAAAVMYLLGERFDKAPFDLFVWRGRELSALQAALRRAA